MSTINDYFSAIQNTAKTKTYSVRTVQDVKNALSDFGAKPTKDYQPGTKQLFVMSDAASKNETDESSSNIKYLTPVHVELTPQRASAGAMALTLTAGKCLDIAGLTQGATAAFSMAAPLVIQAIAGVAGIEIGYQLADNINEWCKRHSTPESIWGESYLSEDNILVHAIKTVDGVKSFCTGDVIENVSKMLHSYGLFDDYPTITPLEPNIGTTTTYNFTGRFPTIPDGTYTKLAQRLIDNYNLDINNKYIVCYISASKKLTINLFNQNQIDLNARNIKINTKNIIQKGEEVLRISSGNYTILLNQFSITLGGIMTHSIIDQRIPVYSDYVGIPTELGFAFDNFGAAFKEILDNNVLGVNTNIRTDILKDPNAIDTQDKSRYSTDFPFWYDQGIKVSNPTIDDTLSDALDDVDVNGLTEAFPIPIKKKATDTGTKTQAEEQADTITPDDVIDDAIDDWSEVTTDSDVVVNPDPTDVSPPTITPIIPDIPPSQSVHDLKMLEVWNPSSQQLRDFASWLWDNNLDIEQLKKVVVEPMSAIVGLHSIYLPPVITDSGPLSLGGIYVGSGSSRIIFDKVGNQYNHLICGPKFIKPRYNNVHDYISTSCQIYLPFVGFVPLDTSEIMNKWMKIHYNVDYLTGTCLAMIQLADSKNGTYYTAYSYAGNCAVQIPITGANYTGILANIVGLAGGIGAAVMTGGTSGVLTGAVMGANAAMNSHVNITHSGSLGANAGAMGPKKPYLLIKRYVPYEAKNRGHYEGLPQQLTATLGSQKGFTRIKNINLEGLACTEEEKSIIISKLQGGIII